MQLIGLKGIGEKTAASFEKLHISSVEDLLHYYPRDYDYFGVAGMMDQTFCDSVCSIRATIVTDIAMSYMRGKSLINFSVSDGNNKLRITYFNAPYLKKTLKKGETYVFRGVLRIKGTSFYMSQPKYYHPVDYEKLSDTLQPIYSITKGLSNQTVRKTVAKAFEAIGKDAFADPVPERFYEKFSLPDQKTAIYEMHFPKNKETVSKAARRLSYQELFLFSYQLGILRSMDREITNGFPMVEVAQVSRMIEKLPYRLTEDQNKVWQEILEDLTGASTMNRLVQGDVGCGKTILAILALVTCVCNGYQGAFMAPTEVLALQHYENVCKMAKDYELPLNPVLLTGSLGSSAKKQIYQQISSGEINLIIGTHALFQEKVTYKNLGLVITDEQHRFGVLQRQKLNEKGVDPHILVMSATPIPRTLALILYGQLRISTIHQMPADRKAIKNCVVGEEFREKAYAFVEAEVEKGHQVYIICPMIEESEQPDLENVIDYSANLKSRFGDRIRVGTLHGKMRPADKNRIMEDFSSGNIDVLVSTTVVEVGVNVPNATLMMVENAERFGLAQLHQLRGRVGRGNAQSYCIFLFHGKASDSVERLKILEKTNDGFEIANEDMRLRGPGDLFGIRQSGGLIFQIADIYRDSDLLIQADHDVRQLLNAEDEQSLSERENLQLYLETHNQNQVDFRSI